MNLSHSAILVAGGASGLGEATVRHAVGCGAQCVVLDMDAERGNAIMAEFPGQVSFVYGSITSPDDVDCALDTATRHPLRLAVVSAFHSAGGGVLDKRGAPLDLDKFRNGIEINLVGTFNVLSRAAARFAKHEADADGQRGVVITTGSISAFEGQNHQIAYSGAKAGVVGMTLPAARDLERHGIRVMCIAPGTFLTPVVAALPESYQTSLADVALFPRRMGNPAEYAKLVQHIFENAYLNGETIRLDGGTRLPMVK